MLRKENSAVEGDPKKSWNGIESKAGAKKQVGLEVSLVGIQGKEGSLTFAWSERKTPVLRPALQSKQSSLCGLHCGGNRGRGGPNIQIVSIKRTADGRRQRSWKIINEKREKYRANNGSLRNTSTDSKETTFVILKNHASAPIRNERLSPTSKARREASRNEFEVKGGMPDRVKSFREINNRQDCPTARPGFVKPIQKGLRKVQNLIECRPFRAETGLAGREDGIRFRKEE